MLNYLSADWVFPVHSAPIRNGVLVLNNEGEIVDLLRPEQAISLPNIQFFNGALIPGLINTHCHLELSHLKGKIEERTGLPGFIRQILAQRQQPEEEVLSAMQQADETMYANGIVAVGDISNVLISKSIKEKSKIYYHTFVEVFGFNRPSEPIIEVGLQLKRDFSPLKASVVPHAPYSVSRSLFNAIDQIIEDDDILSIHNQETQGENELFETGTGAFAEFFADLGIAQSEEHKSGKNSLRYHLPQLNKRINTLLVHNTFSAITDLEFAQQNHQKLFWCLCPKANLYIENTLPNVEVLQKAGVIITLGTDSLASNHELNILAEMKILQLKENCTFEETLTWATINGAKFLGIDDRFGSFEVGKVPGVNLIKLTEDFQIESCEVQKII